MKRVLIGHRGVGKTALVHRHQGYFPEIAHFDLDHEIEKQVGRSTKDYFTQEGETAFRKREQEVFLKLIENKNFVISLGAGFNVDYIPDGIEVVYVSRRTDSDGRIFLDRPRLNPHASPLTEYHMRYQQREGRFRSKAHWIYHLPEGLENSDEIEKQIFQQNFKIKNGYVVATLYSQAYLKMFQKIELRTDLFTDQEIEEWLKNSNEFLISYRRSHNNYKFRSGLIDWSLELGDVPSELENTNLIVSVHDGTVNEGIVKLFPLTRYHQKLCPIVQTWDELIEGYRWQQQDPIMRSFLPRTRPGEKSLWRWFRILMMNQQKINFVQGMQDFEDQPSIYEVMQPLTKTFGAVMGFPIHHSRTPQEQYPHIKKTILSVPAQQDHFHLALFLLSELGLRFAALTSPLKKAAKDFSVDNKNCNSIVMSGEDWIGTSTDEYGFQKLAAQIPPYKKIVIWGGSGILEALKIPGAVQYSAQTRMPRDGYTDMVPEILIWAAPRLEGIQFPDHEWAPEMVVDLNYADNSMGLEYAQKTGAQYISGLTMFRAQAEKQREFWKKHLKDLE